MSITICHNFHICQFQGGPGWVESGFPRSRKSFKMVPSSCPGLPQRTQVLYPWIPKTPHDVKVIGEEFMFMWWLIMVPCSCQLFALRTEALPLNLPKKTLDALVFWFVRGRSVKTYRVSLKKGSFRIPALDGGSGLLQRAGYQSKTLSYICFLLIALFATQSPILAYPAWA